MGRFDIIKPFLARNKWRYIIGVTAILVVNMFQLQVPRLLGVLTDRLQQRSVATTGLFYYVGVIMLLALGVAVGRYLWRIYVAGTSRMLEYYVRDKLFRHLQRLSANYFNEHKTGDLMAHATNDVNAIRMALGPGVVMATDALFLTTMSIATMIRSIDLRLTVMALLPLPFMVGIIIHFGRVIHARFRRVQEAFSFLTDVAQENLNGMSVVKAFVQEEPEIEKFREAARANVNRNLHLVRMWGLFHPLVQFISAVSFFIVLGYGGTLVVYGEISLGDFVAFNGYLMLLVWPMMAIGFMVNVLQRGLASLDRLNVIFNEVPEIRDIPTPVSAGSIEGGIEFRNLTFSYRDDLDPVLQNVSLKLAPGETLGVVGATGTGKTTLVNLIVRLYDPPPGTLFIDGVDVRRLPLAVLRKAVGYVPQDNFLFSTTVEKNIAFALDTYSHDQVESAARSAQVYDNVVDFPGGFETMVGERGVTLSGGQKQRISIARAVIKDPSILILDDALSAVDTHTEEQILKELREIMRSRTSIVIAHRISTIKDADQIIVLDDGGIRERGRHDQLLAQDGIYADMYRRQLLEERIRTA